MYSSLLESTEPPIVNALVALLRKQSAEAQDFITSTRNSYSFIIGTGMLAVLSAVVFFYASIPAGERYAAMVPHSDWFFIWATASFGGLTMMAFDWEIFFSMWRDESSFWSYLSGSAKTFYQRPFQVLFALCAGIGNIIPFWFVSLRKDLAFNMLITASTLAALFIFYGGTELCYQVAAYSEMQLLALRCRLFLACMTGENVQELERLIAWANIKLCLYNRFKNNYNALFYANDEERIVFFNSLNNASNENAKLSILLNVTELTPQPNLVEQSNILSGIKYLCLDIPGILQNFGHAVEAWEAGLEWHISFAVIFTFFNLIPSIGFTLKGILGITLLHLFCDYWAGRTSQMQRLLPGYINALAWIMRLVYILSGLGSDTINYIASKYLGASEEVACVIAGFSNIGTALVFNGPQCEALWIDLTESLMLLQPETKEHAAEIVFQHEFRGFCTQLRSISLKDVESLVNNDEKSPVFALFVANQPFLSTTMSALGLSYQNA